MNIIADGKTDNNEAIKSWIKAGGGTLPSGVIRITESIIIGGIILKDYTNPDSSSLDINQYNIAKFAEPIKIIGHDRGTVIWLDNPDKTKAVIYYNALGWNGNVINGLISNITLKGNGIGISTAYTQSLKLYDILFKDFDLALILNNAYFLDAKNLRFYNCNKAEYDIRSHMSSFTNTVVAFCNKGFEVHSNQIHLNGYNAQFCNIGLHIVGGNNQIERCVLETTSVTDAQLIIGDKTGLKSDGNVFKTLTISAPYKTAIRWEKTAGSMSLDGGEIRSVNFEVIGTPTVYVKNISGTLPTTITKQ